MADIGQLKRLLAGVEAWNQWREENPSIKIDLSVADLGEADISEANLREADLRGSDLRGADLINTDLQRAILRDARLGGANLFGAYLRGADLCDADLRRADLDAADLCRADLRGAYLVGANLNGAILSEAIFDNAILSRTSFSRNDLSRTCGLECVRHFSPSTIGTDTLKLSRGEIPEGFLRGCGLSDWEIESGKLYKPGLRNDEINTIIYKIFDMRAQQAVQVSPLFISYSHADGAFVDKVGDQFTKMGVRYWRDVHDAKAGRLETQIDYAMRQNPTVLLVLSRNSIDSDWVVSEAHHARGLEKELKRDVLCPVALDDSWKTSNWPQRLMEQIMEYNILDYSGWRNDKHFENVFGKLIAGLDMFYKK